MKCDKCGAELASESSKCPFCEAQNMRNDAAAADTAPTIRQPGVPQRPKAAYPEGRPERRRRKKRGKYIVACIFAVVVLALIAVAIIIGSDILKNGGEDPDLDIQPPLGDDINDTDPDGTEDPDSSDTDVLPAVYSIEGMWTWDSDTAFMEASIWSFTNDGRLLLYYFGGDTPEQLYALWPTHYSYDDTTGILQLAGEEIQLSWQGEDAFTLNSAVLGLCDAQKTDAEHIPTGAIVIENPGAPKDGDDDEDEMPPEDGNDGDTVSGGVYIFPESNSRYLTKAECEALTAEVLRIARNEVYARRGRLFDAEDLQAYFNSQDWYEGKIKPASFNYDTLNDYERYNVNLMKSVEDAKK